MANSISIYKDTIEEEAQHTIGVCYPDKWGYHWSYVEFSTGTYKTGHVVADRTPANLVGATNGVGTVTTANDTNLLIDNSSDNWGTGISSDMRGALGMITGGTGVGQSFIVTKHLSADTLEIQVFGKQGGAGWTTAVATDSTYTLRIPGRVGVAGAGRRPRGVWQGDDFTVPNNEFRYGFVKQEGPGEVLVDADDTALSLDTYVIAAGSGLVKGVPGDAGNDWTFAIVQDIIESKVGVAILRDMTGSADAKALVDLDIQNRLKSWRHPRRREEPRISVS